MLVKPSIVRGLLAAAALALALAACQRVNTDRPTAAAPTTVAIADEKEVHSFCGAVCHAYPPADTFPKKHWRNEVQRAYGFFEKSAMSMQTPPIEAVIRYYEERAPEELPPAELPEPHPLPVEFERVTYPPPVPGKLAISHVSVVHLTHPTGGPPDLLATDMQNGRIMLMTPADPKPAWRVLGQVTNPAHATVVDLDGDGILDILVADLGSYSPTDRACGSVAWLKGRGDGTYADPVILLKDVGRVADVQAADFRGTGRLDLIVGVFGLLQAGEVILLENETTDWSRPRFVPRQIDKRHGAIHVPVADL